MHPSRKASISCPPPLQGGSQPGDFDAAGAASRQVVRDIDTKQFFMFYEGVAADGTRSIGLAVSKDGLKGWKRYPQPILSASEEEGAWDSGAVGTPCAVSMAAGRWRLYYAGRQQDRCGGALLGRGLESEGWESGGRRRGLCAR